jgi:hypothetical protein
VPSVLEAIELNVWKLFHDGVLKGSIAATYTSGDFSLRIRRVGDQLIVGFSDGSPDQIIMLRDANALNKATVRLETMLCPSCGRSSLSLYLYGSSIKCKKCHAS